MNYGFVFTFLLVLWKLASSESSSVSCSLPQNRDPYDHGSKEYGFTWSMRNGIIRLGLDAGETGIVWSLAWNEPTNFSLTIMGPSPVPQISVLGSNSIEWAFHGFGCDSAELGSQILTLNLIGKISFTSGDSAFIGSVNLKRRFQMFPEHAFVRMWAEMTNEGHDPISLNYCEIANLSPNLLSPNGSPAVPFKLSHVEQWSWVYRQTKFNLESQWITPGIVPLTLRMGSHPSQFGAPSSISWFALQSSDENNPVGVVAGLEFNGKSTLSAFSDGLDGTNHVVVSVDELNHTIYFNETFYSPAHFVGVFTGDLDEAGYVTQRFTEATISPPLPSDDYPFVQYDSWSYGLNINETNQLDALAVAIDLGLEVFVLDLGWANQIGDWWPTPKSFRMA
eukprot:TRINITY_DN8207_c0_g1_i1.p1 TRINITY_DN8207_c0_g1~~TRINITY_DN8207_c0_g1_i1.p1  ORF type:complete len:393 (-),score=51.98 TRINITY_DN8207_c0_g1_i1:1092-2270(-)